MDIGEKQWSGDEWQEHVLLLLQRHYGPGRFQPIPDQHRGDAGLEGWADDGCAYQCYAAEHAYSGADLLTKQKRKMSRDVTKFRENRSLLLQMFGLTKIKWWIFVVPQCRSKDLLIFGEQKAEEVRQLALPYVTPDFCIRISNTDEFAVERQQLMGVGLAKLPVTVGTPPQQEIREWFAGNEKLVRVLDGKLARMQPSRPAKVRNRMRDELIKHFVGGQNALAEIRENYGELYERVIELQERQEQLLAAESLTTTAVPPQVLRDTLNQFEQTLAKNVPGIDDLMARKLAWGTVADWLLRCPLDFEEVA